MFQRSSLKTYLVIRSLIFLFALFLINFYISPTIIETLSEFSPEGAKEAKNKIFILTIFAIVFLFFLNFYFLSIERNLKEEEEKLKKILNTNPNDRLVKDKLDQIERKRKNYFGLVEIVFTIAIGIVIGFLAQFLIKPLYNFLGTIK